MDFRLLAPLGCRVGESPVWDDRRGVLFCCDVLAGKIFKLTLDGDILATWSFDGPVGSFGLAESGRLVIALKEDVVLFNPDVGEQSVLVHVDEPAGNRLNDSKVGPDGCYYVGSMDDRPEKEPTGVLYRIDANGGLNRITYGFKVSNGLAWSPDGRRMYHSDSRGPWVDVYDFDAATGTASNRSRFADLDQATGRPDGAACDVEGNYWSAGVSAGAINRIAPDGRIVGRYPVPPRAPTMPCFCGPDLDQLVITSLGEGLPPEGNDGHLFIAQANVAGAPVGRMKGL